MNITPPPPPLSSAAPERNKVYMVAMLKENTRNLDPRWRTISVSYTTGCYTCEVQDANEND